MCTILKSENGARRPKTKERGNKEIYVDPMVGRFEFIWSLLLMVTSQRVRIVFISDGKCYMCGCGVLETIAHRFWVSATLQRDHL